MTPLPLGILALAGVTGGGGAYDLLESETLTSGVSNITFDNLDTYSDYQHLQIRLVGKTTAYPGFYLRFNSDTGSNYAMQRLFANGTNVTSAALTNWDTMIFVNSLPDESSTSNEFGAAVADILDFSNSSKHTTVRMLSGAVYDDYPTIALHSGLWENTNAVTSIEIIEPSSGTFVAGSRFGLYGSKGA
jgi:hypothetical protein|tara:strand:- start:2498 stop:3064 length:567 start_codon:yes stop_codon:yes gene_type:complete